MMSRKTILIAAGVLLAAGGVAAAVAAQGHRGWRGGDGMPGMEDQDLQGRGGFFRRGELTEQEHAARTRERFARLDKNSDGVIDAAEVEAALADRMGQMRERMGTRMGERMLRRFDENKDGKVTKDEFDRTVRKMFSEIDLNSDGKITDDDLPPMMRGRSVLGEAGGSVMMGAMGMGGHHGGGRMMQMLRGADANKDGTITQDEALAQAGKMFAQMDRNKDNVVDQSDFDAMLREMVDYRVKRFIHHFGADKDGKVTREQFEKVSKDRFAMGDLNNDGRISRDEMPGRGRWGHRHGDDDRRGPGERRGHGPMMGPAGGPGPGMGGPGRN